MKLHLLCRGGRISSKFTCVKNYRPSAWAGALWSVCHILKFTYELLDAKINVLIFLYTFRVYFEPPITPYIHNTLSNIL